MIPPTDSLASFATVSIEEPSLGRKCWVHFGQVPNSCIYRDLKPGQKYRFMYRLVRKVGGPDIISENRYKWHTMPTVCKLSVPTSDIFNTLCNGNQLAQRCILVDPEFINRQTNAMIFQLVSFTCAAKIYVATCAHYGG